MQTPDYNKLQAITDGIVVFAIMWFIGNVLEWTICMTLCLLHTQ
jgi:hypothetical protein